MGSTFIISIHPLCICQSPVPKPAQGGCCNFTRSFFSISSINRRTSATLQSSDRSILYLQRSITFSMVSIGHSPPLSMSHVAETRLLEVDERCQSSGISTLFFTLLLERTALNAEPDNHKCTQHHAQSRNDLLNSHVSPNPVFNVPRLDKFLMDVPAPLADPAEIVMSTFVCPLTRTRH